MTENREFAAWLQICHRNVMMKGFKCGSEDGLTGKTGSTEDLQINAKIIASLPMGVEL